MRQPRLSGSSTGPATTVVIGAGIVGCATAFRLAHAGHRVLLVDRDGPGQGCSRGNAGVLATQVVEPLPSPETLSRAVRYLFGRNSPLVIRPRYLLRALPWLARFALAARHVERGTAALAALQERSLAAFAALLADAGLSELLKARGHLLVTEDLRTRPELQALSARLATYGRSSRWLDRHAVRQLAPGLSDSVAGGLYFADTAHVVDPLRVCRGLAAAVGAAGGSVERAEIRAIRPRTQGGFELEAVGRRIDCTAVVVAAGAFSAPLARQLGERVPLETERGYHLTLPAARRCRPLPGASRISGGMCANCCPVSMRPGRPNGWASARPCPTTCRSSAALPGIRRRYSRSATSTSA